MLIAQGHRTRQELNNKNRTQARTGHDNPRHSFPLTPLPKALTTDDLESINDGDLAFSPQRGGKTENIHMGLILSL
jgi:hypothetical protein